ncbi:MAG: chromosome segregation protein SMC [Clostridium sp.]
MYLKSIEIQGFKSFANKILFEFHNGITGIVGPNGSGKSNVADAVRWVLGEQRIKQLRGGSMQDVIFSGTETRKPQGFAYVAITLDNSDHQLSIEFEELIISRRLYRSGESEYMINGSPCRLKDINELFYDTGIGKEGYSIIGQGQIDRILSGKPEERRELFDEAAGIVKFKRRKLIAQKKLEDEKQNLLRASDILSELEKQVGPLEKQSETAKVYLQLREELKKLDVNLFLMETSSVKTQLKELGVKETILSGDLESVNQESETLRTEYDELGERIAALDELITNEREKISQSGLLKGTLEGQINVLNEQINTEKMNAEHIKSRMDTIDAQTLEKQDQREAYEQERAALSMQVEEVLARLKAAEADLTSKDIRLNFLEDSIEACKTVIIETLNEKASLAAKCQRYVTMLEQVDVRRSEVCQKLLKFKSDESIQEEQVKAEHANLSYIETQLAELSGQEENLETTFSETEEAIKHLNKKLNDKQQEYHTNYTKLESLRNMAERYDGYGGSIRRVMEAKDRIYGIHGVVADIISTSKEYEVAIETALGGSIQNVVTDSEQTAKQLIEYLKKNRYGRATFLPLSSIGNKNGFSQEQALKEPGVLGLASNLAIVGKEYEGLAKYLLGRVLVVDQIDHAIALAKKYKHTLRIVTLEGELLSAGGSMTGGAFKNSSNLLGRKREIEELEALCEKALRSVEQIQKDFVQAEELLTETKTALAAAKVKKQEISLAQNTSRMNISQFEGKKQEIADSSTDLTLENRELEAQMKEIRSNQALLNLETEKLEEVSTLKNQEIDTYSRELEELKNQRETCALTLSSVQLEAAGVKQKDNFIEENIKRIILETEKLEEERNTLFENSGQAISDKLALIEEIRRQIEEAGKESTAWENSVIEKQKDKEERARQQKSFFEKQEELSQRRNHLDKDLFRLQNQKEKLSERLEEQTAYMWSEYELTYSGAETLKDESCDSIPSMKKQVEERKNQIRALGNVNVNAIEDYKEVSERYIFMKTQHEDLVTAGETLLKIIEELDIGMRRQFSEKFKEISREFDKVFRELFGGGHGSLELMEDEDVLEAGIQIISQPPGKKLQNMMQLSGGEKALTAIALLFAIQNLKPSPFCLLDEIEAALDDSNVDRFAGYLHKLTKYTQFIVITHRRGTMIASDRLYGITMQEKGVSTLVSVNLIESELN